MRRAYNAPAPPKPPRAPEQPPPLPPKPPHLRANVKAREGREPVVGVGGDGQHTRPRTDTENQTPEAQTQISKQKRDDPNSQHSTQGKERTKKSFMDKVQGGLLVGLGSLSMAVLLAAIIQGAIDCENIDRMEPKITAIKSAAWPEYPDWWPDWAPQPQADTHKVWITYDPAVHLLSTDTITITASNTAGTVDTSISGTHSVLNNDDDATTQIEIAGTYNTQEIDFSNVTATMDISTSCEDRIAYTAGKDLSTVVSTGSDVFGSFFGSIPWKSILIVLVCFLAGYFIFKGVSILRS